MTLPNLTLVLGGAASGKSSYAETCIKAACPRPTYIATAQVFDDEMAAKVARHRDLRGADWHTIEEPLDIAGALDRAPAGQPVLIDCATLWLTNVILGEHDLATHQDQFLEAISGYAAPVVIVSNEVGQGIVPDNALSRRFRGAQGAVEPNDRSPCDHSCRRHGRLAAGT